MKVKEAERPKRDKTENPQEEHPVTTSPKTALPPTERLSLFFCDSSLIIVFAISKTFNPTKTEVKISKTRSVLEKAVRAPSSKLRIRVYLYVKG